MASYCAENVRCVGFGVNIGISCAKHHSPTAGPADSACQTNTCGWYSKSVPARYDFGSWDSMYVASLALKGCFTYVHARKKALLRVLSVILLMGVELRNLARVAGVAGAILDT
jgi:hypothetical protein